ncbi:hypothetical protein RDWZM_001963 [Blomia tropicalis]|uniref:Catalase core domain-containing protein n=1 Tax=Blomia tropicalis TaxID=40697 RepID=A0A9Q0RPG5_BLOTA|nr:hypothetical protein RDWZM_001963 [Blomia tropicalis]
MTTVLANPVGSVTNSLTVDKYGPILLQDVNLLEELARFDRERIPERVVHAKGSGAFGEFVVTSKNITKYCKADLFNEVGKVTPVAVRFSTVIKERGSTDTERDLRGFATKFYTREGNYDLVGLDVPVFFVRDPFMFPKFIHSQKKNPQTGLFDYNSRWDFISLRPETLHVITIIYGDRGIPNGFRHMNGFGTNTFKLVNSKGKCVYNKFHWRTNQVTDPDYAAHDLYDAIERKKYPSWTLYIQVMSFDEADKWEFNPFDDTKIWPETDFPLIEVGRLTLKRNQKNFFAEIEQLAFSPANLVPGIEFSPDKILNGRIVAYSDAQRHRIGANFDLIPVNQPMVQPVHPTIRDGPMNTSMNEGSMPNYYPNSFELNIRDHPKKYNESRQYVKTTDIDRFVSDDEDNYTQVNQLYLSYSADERKRLHKNIANDLYFCYDFIANRVIAELRLVHEDYANGVYNELKSIRNSKVESKAP